MTLNVKQPPSRPGWHTKPIIKQTMPLTHTNTFHISDKKYERTRDNYLKSLKITTPQPRKRKAIEDTRPTKCACVK